MWIIPKNLQLSSGAPDTAGFISDLNEQSQICASSLMVRSKPSQPRIWSQKWRRDSWTQHLSGRILKPSHARSFATAWASLSPVIPVSHSQQPESGSELKTLATSGRTSQEQLELFALDSVSLKMSKDTSASDSAKSLESWEQSVIRRRGEYSARLKSGRLTSASGSSSWPTIRASEYKDVGPVGSKSHDHMLGKHYLCAVVTQEAWQTPTTNMDMVRSEDGIQKRKEFRASIGRKSIPDGNLGEQMQRLHGQAAPASSSSLGSRPELWPSARPSGSGTHNAMSMKNAWCRIQKTGYRSNLEEALAIYHGPSPAKLNPRWVETLMGLPVGWTMPSCKSPVTIELTSCDSSATESCQQQQSELF